MTYAKAIVAPDGGEWTLTPTRSDVVRSFGWAGLLSLLFFSVYGFCNWATVTRENRWRFWYDFELAIPLVPWMVWPYLSLILSFFLPMFALRAGALDALCRRLSAAVIVSGLVFLLLPAEAGFERPVIPPNLAFALIYALDAPHNLMPSLHISWAAIILWSLRRVSSIMVRRLLEAWFILLCVAVVLTHQHHILDVLGGILVACATRRVVRADGSWSLTKGGSA